MRITYLAWNRAAPTWGRFIPQLQALGNKHEVVVATPYPQENSGLKESPLPPPPRDLWDYPALSNYAVKAATHLPDCDLLLSRNGGPMRQLLDIHVAQVARLPLAVKLGGDGFTVRQHYAEDPALKIKQDTVDVFTLRNMDMIIPLTIRLRDIVLTIVFDDTRVTTPVPLGADLRKFPYTEPPDKLEPGYIGRWSREKGTALLRQVFSQRQDLQFHVAGPLEEPVFFPRNTHYWGLIPYDQIQGFYQATSIVLLPSKPGCEGLPNAALEAYQAGRPIICTEGLLPPELPVFGWELPENPRKWSKLLETLTPTEARNIGLYARDWVRKNWPKWVEYGERMNRHLERCVERFNAERRSSSPIQGA